MPPVRPLTPQQKRLMEIRRRQAIEKINRERFKEHKKLFSTFVAKPKSSIREKPHEKINISKPKPKGLKPAPKKIKAKKSSEPKDVFKELSKVAAAELGKYNKKDKKKI